MFHVYLQNGLAGFVGLVYECVCIVELCHSELVTIIIMVSNIIIMFSLRLLTSYKQHRSIPHTTM